MIAELARAPEHTGFLLAGPPLSVGAEPYESHLRRLGPLPPARQRQEIITALASSGLLGRGGAHFPVGRKWRAVAQRSHGNAVVLVNGAEGEPLSIKDRTLMAKRPHLVLDGALVAADAVGARDIVLYIGTEHRAALVAMSDAARERRREFRRRVRIIEAPAGYISGEESAAVHFVDSRIALPTTTPPRPFERGVGGRPTLVQNVESLAVAAEAAHRGSLLDAWGEVSSSSLFTVTGAVRKPGLQEASVGTAIRELIEGAGGLSETSDVLLLGGYFGSFVSLDQAWDLSVDQRFLRPQGLTLGCGIVSVLPASQCGVKATAQIISFMAGSSARQCGPCLFGLSAIAQATERLARRRADSDDLARITRWSEQIAGRGACRHPDGAVGLLASALRVFKDEFACHQVGRCTC